MSNLKSYTVNSHNTNVLGVIDMVKQDRVASTLDREAIQKKISFAHINIFYITYPERSNKEACYD